MSTFSERLRLAIEKSPYSQSELARRIGLKPQAIQYLADPKNNAKGSRHLHLIAKELSVNPEWLASGNAPMRALKPAYEISKEFHERQPHTETNDRPTSQTLLAQLSPYLEGTPKDAREAIAGLILRCQEDRDEGIRFAKAIKTLLGMD